MLTAVREASLTQAPLISMSVCVCIHICVVSVILLLSDDRQQGAVVACLLLFDKYICVYLYLCFSELLSNVSYLDSSE